MAIRKRGAAPPDAEPKPAALSDLELSVAEAEARAEEAEAAAAAQTAEAEAARARARAIRLRREAEAAAEAEQSAPEDSAGPAPSGAGAVEFADGDGSPLDSPSGAVAPKRSLRRRIAGYAAAALAIVAIVASGVASGWIIWNHRTAEHQRELAAEFSAGARQGVVSLMSLDFKKAKDDVQRIIDNSTGQFKEDFGAQASDFAKVAESSKVVTEANVTATAVKTMTADNADVLVVANSTITNAQGAKQSPRNWRLIVTMTRDGDQVKMSRVEFAP